MSVVRRIHLYPIKSLDPQEVAFARVLPSGALEHDRAYAVVDADGAYVNGKRHPSVHRLRSHLDIATGRLELRDESSCGLGDGTFDIRADRQDLCHWLGAFFGFDVALAEDRDTGFPDDSLSPGPTVVSTATLIEISRWFDLALPEVRTRFRTNIEIDEVPPFWEDRLFGAVDPAPVFRVGDTSFRGINCCQRCNVPSRNPWTGENDPAFAKRFVTMRRSTLPAWSDRKRFDHYYRVAVNTRVENWRPSATVRVGDKVVEDLRGAPLSPDHVFVAGNEVTRMPVEK